MSDPETPMTFTFSTALHRRKMIVDGNDEVVEKARYVDVDPMHIHVKDDDIIIFKAMDGALTVKDWPGGEFTVQEGDSVTKTVPKGSTGHLQLKFTIKGEDPKGRNTDEDPDLILDDKRP